MRLESANSKALVCEQAWNNRGATQAHYICFSDPRRDWYVTL